MMETSEHDEEEKAVDWQKEAKQLLRIELVRKDISYKELVRKLEKLGVQETDRAIQSKIARGTFSFAFYLQCMRAIETRKVDLEK